MPKSNTPVTVEKGDFSETVKQTLREINAFRCANPDCRVHTVYQKLEVAPKNADKSYRLADAAHIEANQPGAPRYNSHQTPAQRKHIDNAIWLCNCCHRMVDSDKARFPVSRLREGKQKSENLFNYSAPLFALPNYWLYLHQPLDGWDASSNMIIGGNILLGPSNIDGVCTSIWLEVFSCCADFVPSSPIDQFKALRMYEDGLGLRDFPKAREHWRPFLIRLGFDGRLMFEGGLSSGVNDNMGYRLGISVEVLGMALTFYSPPQIGVPEMFDGARGRIKKKVLVAGAVWPE